MLRNKSAVLLGVVALSFTLLGSVQSTNAQVLFGSVSGTITDQSGAAVSKAHVTSVNKATGIQRETDADGSGHYTLTDLSPGAYDITVTASGFKPLTQTDVSVGANVVTNTNCNNLQVGSVSEKITVEAAAVTLQTEKTDVHTEIPEKAIQEMPLNQYRNYQTLINLVPGATPGQFQNAIADTPERALTTNINGTNRNNNNTRVDGAAGGLIRISPGPNPQGQTILRNTGGATEERDEHPERYGRDLRRPNQERQAVLFWKLGWHI